MDKTDKAELLRRFDKITESLAQLDADPNEGYDSQLLLPQLLALYQAARPFADSIRPKPRKKVKRSELSDWQRAMLERFRETGRVSIYEGYRRAIRTADSLERKGLIKRDFNAFGLTSTSFYELTDTGRALLDKLPAC